MADLEQRRKRGTWTNEGGGTDFHGASDSIIDAHRPNLALDPGRRSSWKWVMLVFVLLLIGAGVSAWFWGDDLVQWLQSEEPAQAANDTDADTDADTDGDAPASEASSGGAPTGAEAGTGAPAATGVPTEPPPPKNPWATADDVAATGTPATTGTPAATGTPASTGAPAATGTPAATGAPATTGTPAATGTVTAQFTAFTTSAVSKSRVQKLWSEVTAKAQGCVDGLGPGAGTFKGELKISLGVKWNGGATGLSVKGSDLPKGLDTCVRSAIPRARYPQPPPGRDGRIRATLQIERR